MISYKLISLAESCSQTISANQIRQAIVTAIRAGKDTTAAVGPSANSFNTNGSSSIFKLLTALLTSPISSIDDSRYDASNSSSIHRFDLSTDVKSVLNSVGLSTELDALSRLNDYTPLSGSPHFRIPDFIKASPKNIILHTSDGNGFLKNVNPESIQSISLNDINNLDELLQNIDQTKLGNITLELNDGSQIGFFVLPTQPGILLEKQINNIRNSFNSTVASIDISSQLRLFLYLKSLELSLDSHDTSSNNLTVTTATSLQDIALSVSRRSSEDATKNLLYEKILQPVFDLRKENTEIEFVHGVSGGITAAASSLKKMESIPFV